jgi:tetratricopeptide (TPR) repeat protein
LRFACCEEDSTRFYSNALEKDPNNGKAHVGLAVSLYFTHDYEGALHHFRTARALDPGLLQYLGEDEVYIELLKRLGEWKELIEVKIASTAHALRAWQALPQSDLGKAIDLDRKLHKRPTDPTEASSGDEAREEASPSFIEPDSEEAPEFYRSFLEARQNLTIDEFVEFAETLPQPQQNELGKWLFRASWFGDLCQKRSMDEVEEAHEEEQN